MPITPRHHAAKALYKAPLETPTEYRCISLSIPDGDEWLLMLRSALSTMTTWLNYQRSGTTRESEVAQIWREIMRNIGECPVPEIILDGANLPVGAVVAFPIQLDSSSGWLPCNGQLVSRLEYEALYFALSDANDFWNGQYPDIGADEFRIPLLNDISEPRTIFGASIDNNKYTGAVGGSEEHTLTVDEMPAHHHTAIEGNFIRTLGAASANLTTGGGAMRQAAQTSTVGGGDPHNNMPPYIRMYWHILAVPGEQKILDDLKLHFIQDVYASDCTIFKVKNDETFPVLVVSECIEGYEPDEPWEEVEPGNTPDAINDNDCIWGGVDAAVEWLLEKTDDFLDILEQAGEILDSITDAFPLTWVNAKFIGDIYVFLIAVSVAVARLQLASQTYIDDIKCNLFCRIVENGGLLTPAIFKTWLNWLEPLNITPSSAAGLAIHLTTVLNGYNAVFKRFTLYANNACSDDWMTICDPCSGACVDSYTLEIIWNTITATPIGWISPSTTGAGIAFPDVYRQLTRGDNQVWDAPGSDWRSGCIEFTFPSPTSIDRLGLRARFDTTNQKVLVVSALISGVWTSLGSINPQAPSLLLIQETFEFDEVCASAVRFQIWGVGGRIEAITINQGFS